MKPTWAEGFPRLYELYLESDKACEANYFAKLDEALEMPGRRPHYEQLEKGLQQVEDTAWQEFRLKVRKYITIKDDRRGYSQLFDCFNEVKGYLYLKSEGCDEIHFVPEKEKKGIKSPDLCAHSKDTMVLLEVKTINRSDDEINWICRNSKIGANGVRRMEAKEARQGLTDPLKVKIAEKINLAEDQLVTYACEGVKRRIAYLVINLDILDELDQRNRSELEKYIQLQGDNHKQIEVTYSGGSWLRVGNYI